MRYGRAHRSSGLQAGVWTAAERERRLSNPRNNSGRFIPGTGGFAFGVGDDQEMLEVLIQTETGEQLRGSGQALHTFIAPFSFKFYH